jgi:hypothetical protein
VSAAPPLYSARVRTTEAMVRRAVRAFLWRRVYARSRLWLGVFALLAVSVAVDGWTGPSEAAVASAAVLLLACAMGGVFVWWQWRNMVRRVRRTTPAEATVSLGEANMTLSSGAGRATLAWADCTEAWDLGDFMMLFSAPDRFISVPLVDLPAEAGAFLRSRVAVAGKAVL